MIGCIPIAIKDTPRYPWRGLLVDTANHFIPIDDLLTTIDARVSQSTHLSTIFCHCRDCYPVFPIVLTMLCAAVLVCRLAMNKMNVLHWHIVDSYSFPMVSKVFPQLSKLGAWSPEATYSVSECA